MQSVVQNVHGMLRQAPAVVGAPQQYLVFMVGGEAYALDILQIREIIEFGQVTEVPMTPAMVRGVINLRGAVVPVIDLSARFGRGRADIGRRTCIVILEMSEHGAAQTVGIVVDSVTEVLEIAAADIEPPPTFGARLRTGFIAGMGRLADKFVIILELGRVLALDEIAQLAEMAGEGGPSTPAEATERAP